MNDHDGYLSKDRQHLAALQRQRRARMVRIDYMPSEPALRVFKARQQTVRPGSAESTNSAVLDAILLEWAQLTGINNQKQKESMTSGNTGIVGPGARVRAHAYDLVSAEVSAAGKRAHAYDSRTVTSEVTAVRRRTRTYDFEAFSEQYAHARVTSLPAPAAETRCGARRHRDGQPCQARPEPGKRRCRFHGGRSTGPRTAAGRERALANLRHRRMPST